MQGLDCGVRWCVLMALWGATYAAAADGAKVDPAQAAWDGYDGPNGTRIYADSQPPSPVTPANVRWVVPLGWGHGSPLAVGDRVFALCEPDPSHDWPRFICLSAADGKTLWSRELDHLEQSIPDAAARKQTREDWRLAQTMIFLNYAYQYDVRRAGQDAAALAKVNVEYAAKGAAWDGRNLQPTDKGAFDVVIKRLQAQGITRECWLVHGSAFHCVGHVFATPVTDGKSVYVVTAFGSHFCFDFDGKLRWLTVLQSDPPPTVALNDYCQCGRSPLLYGNLFINAQGKLVRALDRDTGKVVWTRKIGGHTIISPAVLKVGGQEILWAAGPSALRLPGGEPLKIEGWSHEGLQILPKYDERDVAFFCGAGEHSGWGYPAVDEVSPPAAVRFSLEGDVLRAKVLWHGRTIAESMDLGGKPLTAVLHRSGGSLWGMTAPWMVYQNDRLYHRSGIIIDTKAGKWVTGKLGFKGDNAAPYSRHYLKIAGDHVYGLSEGGSKEKHGVCLQEFTLDGKQVSNLVLPTPDLTLEQRETAIGIGWLNEGGERNSALGFTFTFGARDIFVRSMMHLFCISAKREAVR